MGAGSSMGTGKSSQSWSCNMFKLMDFASRRLGKAIEARDLGKDEEGAALIEYTVLIALVTLGVIVMIGTVGGKVLARWTTLDGAL